MNVEKKEAEEKRFRTQWNEHFNPEMTSKTEIKPAPQQDKFDGGDSWKEENEV